MALKITDGVLTLANHGALVLGGGQGIGEACALAFARAGADIAIADLDAGRAQEVAQKIEAPGRRVASFHSDAMSEADLEGLPARALAQLPALDRLVTIIGAAEWSPLLDMPARVWDAQQQLNLKHFFIIARAFTRMLRQQQRAGAIVCIASVSGVQSAPGHAAYGAAKAGMISLVKSMAVEWAAYGVRVNAIAPGTIATPRRPDTPERLQQVRDSKIPMRRRGTVDEIASAVLFMASDMASYVTGQTLVVDGGWTAANLLLEPPEGL